MTQMKPPPENPGRFSFASHKIRSESRYGAPQTWSRFNECPPTVPICVPVVLIALWLNVVVQVLIHRWKIEPEVRFGQSIRVDGVHLALALSEIVASDQQWKTLVGVAQTEKVSPLIGIYFESVA